LGTNADQLEDGLVHNRPGFILNVLDGKGAREGTTRQEARRCCPELASASFGGGYFSRAKHPKLARSPGIGKDLRRCVGCWDGENRTTPDCERVHPLYKWVRAKQRRLLSDKTNTQAIF
jgi:hypothetical protein